MNQVNILNNNSMTTRAFCVGWAKCRPGTWYWHGLSRHFAHPTQLLENSAIWRKRIKFVIQGIVLEDSTQGTVWRKM